MAGIKVWSRNARYMKHLTNVCLRHDSPTKVEDACVNMPLHLHARTYVLQGCTLLM